MFNILQGLSVLACGACLLAACGGSPAASTSTAASTAPTSSSLAPASVAKPSASAGAAAPASASPTPAQATVKLTANATLGQILTDGSGRTLYTFDPTTMDPTKCSGACLVAWPAFQSGTAPAAVTGLSGSFAVISRPDNQQKQVTFDNKPLYYFVRDTAPGQATGQGSKGFGGNWQVIKGS